MDPETGRLAKLAQMEDVRPGDVIEAKEAMEKAMDANSMETIEEMFNRAAAEGRKPAPLVAVDEKVVQKLRLGEKELRRRRQRRR